MTSLLTRGARRSVKWFAFFFVAALIALPQKAQAQLRVSFGLTNIYDNLPGDINPAIGVIDFAGVYGPANYQVSGRLTDIPGPTGISASSPLSLTLTNFTATAIAISNLGMPMDVSIQSNTIIGSYLPGTATAQVVAEVGSASSSPIAAGTDSIQSLYHILSDTTNQYPIATAFGASIPVPNPAFSGSGTLAYPVTGHTNSSIPLVTNPTLSGVIAFTLGQLDDQFILPSSYEIGYQALPVPEPSTIMLIGLAGVGAMVYGKKRWKVL